MIQTQNFDDMLSCFRKGETICLVKNCLERIHRLSHLIHGTDHLTDRPERVNVRQFISSYLILAHPTRVFHEMGALEIQLRESAEKTAMVFEQIISGIVQHKLPFHQLSKDLTRSFPIVLFEFLRCFNEWKVVDEAKILNCIKEALVPILELYSDLTEDENAEPEAVLRVQNQIRRFRNKMYQIGGPSVTRDLDSTFPFVLETQSTNVGEIYQLFDDFKCLRNEQIAHELLLQGDFQFTEVNLESFENKTEMRIRKSFERAFWKMTLKDLQSTPQSYRRVFSVITSLKNSLKELAQTEMHQEIEERIDIELIRQQVEEGCFDCLQIMTTIIEIMKRIQHPNRDAELDTLWAEKRAAMESPSPIVFCDVFQFLLDRVRLLKMDAANVRLRLLAPVVQNHGVEYEQGKMRKKLEDGNITLMRTRTWIKESLQRLSPFWGIGVQQASQGNGLALMKAYGSALVDLIENPQMDIPETLEFDKPRFEIMRSQFEWLVASSVIVVTVMQCAGSENAKEAAEGLVIANSTKEEDWKSQCIAVGAAAVGMDALENYMTMINRRLADAAEPVHALMRKRVRGIWEHAVGGAQAFDDELRGAEGLKDLACQLAAELTRVANVNRRVHGAFYDRIIPEVALQCLV